MIPHHICDVRCAAHVKLIEMIRKPIESKTNAWIKQSITVNLIWGEWQMYSEEERKTT